MKARSLFSAVSLLFLFGSVMGQTDNEKINWMTWEQAAAKSREEKKKIILDVYTEWCRWCERMDQVTYQDPQIVKYINENYYAVKFDAEYKGDLEYQGKVYHFVKNGKNGYHELAAELLNGRLSFPSTVFLDEESELIQSIMGYKSPQQFDCIVTYFGANHYKNQPWSAYERSCMPPPQAKPEKQNLSTGNKQIPSPRLIKNR